VEFIEEFIDDGYRVGILDGEGVQRAIVDAEAPRAVRLLDEKHR
jgi:hypothetical protein